MRRILAASILLSPLFFTALAVASTPANDASASTPARPVSTGVIPAHVLYSTGIELPSTATVPNDAEVVLELNVGEDGKARDIPSSPTLSSRVEELRTVFRRVISECQSDSEPKHTRRYLRLGIGSRNWPQGYGFLKRS